MSGQFHIPGGDLNRLPARITFCANSAEAGLASTDAATAYSAAVGLMTCYNSDTTNNRITIIPRRLRLTAKAVNTAGVDFRLAIALDSTNRYTSGGTALTGFATEIDARTGYTAYTSKATINAGLLVTAAASSAEKIHVPTMMKEVIFAIDETIELWWGANGPASIDATDRSNIVTCVPPMWIGPGCTMVIHEVSASQSADPKFQFEFWYEEWGHVRTES